MAPTADDPVTHWKGLTIGLNRHREFGNDRAVAAPDLLCEGSVLRRIKFAQPRSDDCDRSPFRGQRSLMRSGIDATRQAADHSQSGVGKLIREFLRAFCAVMSGATRTNHPDAMLIAFGQFTPNVKHNRGCMNLS